MTGHVQHTHDKRVTTCAARVYRAHGRHAAGTQHPGSHDSPVHDRSGRRVLPRARLRRVCDRTPGSSPGPTAVPRAPLAGWLRPLRGPRGRGLPGPRPGLLLVLGLLRPPLLAVALVAAFPQDVVHLREKEGQASVCARTGRGALCLALHHGGAVGRHPGLPGACRPRSAARPGAGQWGAAVAPRRSPVCGRAVPPQGARASLKDLGLAARGRARRGGRPERPPTPAHAARRRGGQGCQRRRSPTRAGPGSRPGHAAAPQTRPREPRGSPRPRPAPDAHARHAEPSGRTRGTLAPACT